LFLVPVLGAVLGVGVEPGVNGGVVTVPGAVEGGVVPLPGIVEVFGLEIEPGVMGDVPPGLEMV
jgi:hypothetical protein